VNRVSDPILFNLNNTHNDEQEKKAAIAKNALACFGGRDKDEGRLNLEELRRFFL
jgi:hypothetical protein